MKPFLAAVILAVALARPALATSAPATLTLEQMDIHAQTTEYDGKLHTYQVKGVVAIQIKGLKVTCDQATIFTTPQEDHVERIVFSGHVIAHRGPGTFRGERVTYVVADRRLVAEGGTHTHLQLPASGSTPARGTP